ncbi:MAG: hypothetical protein ISS19_07520 [Bacteroidales bacterium]|nr:hypothetical protein [Bacteroidales bacterium]
MRVLTHTYSEEDLVEGLKTGSGEVIRFICRNVCLKESQKSQQENKYKISGCYIHTRRMDRI